MCRSYSEHSEETVASKLASIIERQESELLEEWLRNQKRDLGSASQRVSDNQLRTASQNFLSSLRITLQQHDPGCYDKQASLLAMLEALSRERVGQGFTPAETATFIFSLKQPLFKTIQNEFANDAAALGAETWNATQLLDQLGLFTLDVYQKSREDVIRRQQQEMLELSTPVVELWTGILAVPLIGTLDSERTQVVMQNLLEAIVAKSADLAIIDITGVPTVDTLVAQHLLKTVAAERLMGVDSIIIGIRPQIAQTIIHLGVELKDGVTKATLSAAFAHALKAVKLTIVKTA